MRIYEQNPAAIIALCPKMTYEKNLSHASRPFSACMDCPHHSFMSCNMPSGLSSESSSARPVRSYDL